MSNNSAGEKIEVDCVNEILRGADIKNLSFYERFKQRAEDISIGMSKGETVTFVGSGSLPITLICLWTEFGINGIGIEREIKYVENSKKVIKKLGLYEHIKTVHGNESLLPLGENKVIYWPGLRLVKGEIRWLENG